jgi:hypothetical protein
MSRAPELPDQMHNGQLSAEHRKVQGHRAQREQQPYDVLPSSAGARNETKDIPSTLCFIFNRAQNRLSGRIAVTINNGIGRNVYPRPVRSSGFPMVALRARFGTRAIRFVTTTSSILRVSKRLEPIANVSGDVLVLAEVTGAGVNGQAGNLHGYCQ